MPGPFYGGLEQLGAEKWASCLNFEKFEQLGWNCGSSCGNGIGITQWETSCQLFQCPYDWNG